jgi:hypothetical protein
MLAVVRAAVAAELRYGSRDFRAASDLARNLPYSPPVSALIGTAARRPSLIRTFVAVGRLPVVELRVRRADVDAWAGAYFAPACRGRLAQAVLELPAAERDYLAGRSRQALRTNLRHARERGVTSDRVLANGEWFEAASVILAARPDGRRVGRELDEPGPGQQVAYYVARDAGQAPLAFAAVALFGPFAVLVNLLSHPGRHPLSSWARYQLHTCLALDLGRAGVRHLLVGSALRETAGNQHFQHLLGYRARNLQVEVTGPDAPLAGPVSRPAPDPGPDPDLGPDPAGVARFGGPAPGHPADSGNPEVVNS